MLRSARRRRADPQAVPTRPRDGENQAQPGAFHEPRARVDGRTAPGGGSQGTRVTASTTKLKRLARRRQQETGERYTDALAAVRLPKEVSMEKVNAEKKYVGVPLLAEGSVVPVLAVQGGSAPLVVRTEPLSHPLEVVGLEIKTIAGSERAVPYVRRMRKVRPDGSSVDLLLLEAELGLGEWRDGRRFYGNSILSDRRFVREEALDSGDHLELELCVLDTTDTAYAAVSAVCSTTGAAGAPAPVFGSSRRRLWPLSADGESSAVRVTGGVSEVGEPVRARLLSSPDRRPHSFLRLVGMLFQSEKMPTGVVATVRDLAVTRGGVARTGRLLVDHEGWSLADDYALLDAPLHAYPVVGPGDDVEVSVGAFASGGETAEVRLSAVFQDMSSIGQDLVSAWLDETRRLDAGKP